MDELIDSLMQQDVMNAVGFYAGGAATAIGAVWVAITKMRGKDKNENPDKPSYQTTASATKGIAANRDVSIQGNVSFSQTPKAAWVILGVGVVLLGLAAVFGGDHITVTDGAHVGGDMKNSSINIGQ
ncbi:hypothetical protein M3P21_11345 [Ruegeria sp. 2012CJ41-6]|uniref:Uncharacterized protein n=1 Tax=Ruegeria spongiae TaxID=2942209 RepID=A0ABT0Q2M4_9RHOB|nr:hypothetical protein [Ruegeria spongiae]MCL6284124.1 hypothetical protein [Ruegeria spongiae]